MSSGFWRIEGDPQIFARGNAPTRRIGIAIVAWRLLARATMALFGNTSGSLRTW
jgi:hypothetical protein